MKRIIMAVIIATCLFSTIGCGNLSPRLPRVDNQGKINELENLANSLKAEIGKLQNQAEIRDSQLEKVQQGLANYQSNQTNNGIQILSGTGGLLIAGMIVVVFGAIAYAYRQEAIRQAKTADVLANRIVSKNDPKLTEQVFQAAMYTDVEENILSLMKKHQIQLTLRDN